MERFFSSLVAAGLIRREGWEGTFGSASCPSCDQRDYLYFTEEGGDFRFGCRDQCDRSEILGLLGLEGYDMMRIVPGFMARKAGRL